MTDISILKPDPHNRRKHNPRNVGMIVNALQQVGAARSIVIDEDNTILAGNATIEAAAQAGIEKMQVVEADGHTIIAVRRRGLDAEQKRRLALYDNQTAAIAEWDAEQIAADLQEGLDFTGIFDQQEMADILASINGDPPEDPGPQIDRAAELQEQWKTELGQLWELGEHRLICGDCTDRAVVERVTQGDCPGMMVTDPPYGVDYDPMWRHEAAAQGLIGFSAKRTGKVENDGVADWTSAWRLFGGQVVYVWHAALLADVVLHSLDECGFELRSQIIWAKDSFSISRGHYHWQHEPCWYAVRKGQVANWIGDHSQATLWKINKNDGNDQGSHGTQKPIECMERPIRNHDFPMIYDPFLGSGTTLIACERLGRKCRAIEISPAYVAVSLQRWADVTGRSPVLVD